MYAENMREEKREMRERREINLYISYVYRACLQCGRIWTGHICTYDIYAISDHLYTFQKKMCFCQDCAACSMCGSCLMLIKCFFFFVFFVSAHAHILRFWTTRTRQHALCMVSLHTRNQRRHAFKHVSAFCTKVCNKFLPKMYIHNTYVQRSCESQTMCVCICGVLCKEP